MNKSQWVTVTDDIHLSVYDMTKEGPGVLSTETKLELSLI